MIETTWKILTQYYNWERDPLDDYESTKQTLWIAADAINSAFQEFEQYLEYLTEYNIQFVQWYVWTSTFMMAVWPWKLKAVKVSDRVVDKISGITKIGVLNDIEVKNTLSRIETWIWKYMEDWTVFKNNESLLPAKWDNYYKEWTVDTEWITHRWAKRVVTWLNWEMYYTDDHYLNFIKIK